MSADQIENEYHSIDPFPLVPPALLNSADIVRYGKASCLTRPFDPCPSRLKSAAYTMKFLGTLYSWENERDGLKPLEDPIRQGKTYTLPKNSITYLFTKEEFCLPEYIAARINFRIPFVHKGMLLGTGPLVDAGFQGSLLVPLHNLTNNDYSIEGGEPVIWVEFTKLSPHKYWRKDYWGDRSKRPSDLVEFRKSKSDRPASAYLEKAEVTAKGGVQSAFKGALDETRAATEKAERVTTRFGWGASIGGVISLLTLLAGAGALMYAGFQMNQSNNDMATRIQDQLSDHARRARPHPEVPTADDVEALREELQAIRRRVEQLEETGDDDT